MGVPEQRTPGVDVNRLAAAQHEPPRVIHPRIHRDHRQRAREACNHDRDTGQEVRARREPVPAVDVDRDEDRLDEEREPLEREAEPEDVAEAGHEPGPQQTHLEAEDRPRHDARGEQRDHHLRPAARQRPVERIARAQVERLDEEHHRRKGDPEADERDVDRERERLHLARLPQVVLLNGPEGRCEKHSGVHSTLQLQASGEEREAGRTSRKGQPRFTATSPSWCKAPRERAASEQVPTVAPAAGPVRRSSRGLSGRVRTDGSTASDGVPARGAHARGERADDEAAQRRRGSCRRRELSLRLSSWRSHAAGRVRTRTLRGAGVEPGLRAGRGMQRLPRLLRPAVAGHED